ncbi:MAG: serine hydrolase [Ginsengibacter sp.]
MKTIIKIFRLTFTISVTLGLTGLMRVTSASAQSHHHTNTTFDSCSPAFIIKAQHIIDLYRQKTGTSGIAVAFYDNSKTCILVSGTEDGDQQLPVTSETDFAMGSIQKIFNSTLLALSIVNGKATIEDPAAKYLVGQGGTKVKQDVPFWKISLKELVTHTSALPGTIPGIKYRIAMNLFRDRAMGASVIQYLNTWHPQYEPGTKYNYSNLGFVLVANAAVELGGNPYTKLLAKHISGPLGMIRTGMQCGSATQGCAVGYDEKGNPSKKMPVGLWTTAKDMLRFIEANMGDLEVPLELSKAIEETHKELFRVDSDHAIGMAWEEWHQGDSLLISKDGLGSGFSSWIGFEPNKQRGVVILRNGGKNPSPVMLGKRLLSLSDLQH